MKKYNPYEFNNVEKCVVCGHPVGVDDYGNSDVCKNCGWQNSKDNEIWDKSIGISYPMLVPISRAREQFKAGLPFKATFEDFICGLFFYGEMTFLYARQAYSVQLFSSLAKNGTREPYMIRMYRSIDGEMLQEFHHKDDFYNKAGIDGRLLKDIWAKVETPSFMWCD